MSRAVQRASARFCCSIPDHPLRIGDMPVRLSGRFRFTRLIAPGGGSVRRFEAASLCLVDAQGVAYRVLEAEPAGQEVEASEKAFLRVHRGVLVGLGHLNNCLLTLVLEFTEQHDGAARGEVLAARVEAP